MIPRGDLVFSLSACGFIFVVSTTIFSLPKFCFYFGHTLNTLSYNFGLLAKKKQKSNFYLFVKYSLIMLIFRNNW